jgi:hypothetical protein
VISFERGKQLADSLGVEFFETSAKENINVRVSRPITRVKFGQKDRLYDFSQILTLEFGKNFNPKIVFKYDHLILNSYTIQTCNLKCDHFT